MSMTLGEGKSTILTVEGTSVDGMLFYQWIVDDSALVGETNDILELNDVTNDTEGAYRVLVANKLGDAFGVDSDTVDIVVSTLSHNPISYFLV